MIWDRGKYFLFPWFVFFSAGMLAILIYGKADLHVILNQKQPHSADAFFRAITHLGEGIAVLAGIFYLLFRSRHSAGFLATSWLLTFLVIQLFKQVIYKGSLRPASVFKNTDAIYYIEGVTNRLFDSFPSGHTAEIFSVCFALTLISRNPRTGTFLFIPALLVGYSRIFLSQHFMEDVLAGSFIAILCTSVMYWIWWRSSPSFRRYSERF